MKEITSKIQTIQLHDLPIIPLWYNGMWSQVSNAVWTNWPSACRRQPALRPRRRGMATGSMGAVLMLTELKPVPPLTP